MMKMKQASTLAIGEPVSHKQDGFMVGRTRLRYGPRVTWKHSEPGPMRYASFEETYEILHFD